MMTKEGSTTTVNSITPGTGVLVLGCDHISHIVKKHFLFKTLLLYSQALIRQTKYVVMMTKEGSTKTVNFMTSGAGFLCSFTKIGLFSRSRLVWKKIGIFEYAHRNSFQQANVIAYQ